MIIGGSGGDSFLIDDLGDTVVELELDGGIDRALGSVNGYILANHVDVLRNEKDDVACTLYSSSIGATVIGNSAGDSLVGLGGDDFLYGG
ncbi:MAG: hypothetical protein AAFY02_17240, partial [Pseudomonadota bacterium]